MIVGQNSLLNQYVPTFLIKNLTDGQFLKYDASRKAFVNVNGSGGGGGGASRLGELDDVSASVDNPLSLQNGQALVYNSFTNLWENKFIDYNTLLNKPTSSSFNFIGLSDTATPSLPSGYVKWNSTGTQLVYSTTIPAASITGLAQVATTGDYNDLINKPTSSGTVTNVSIVTANGVSGSVANPTTTPAITLVLSSISPTSVTASGPISAGGDILSSGTITGANLIGTNTGDQTITLTGDVTGSGTGTFSATLTDTGVIAGTYGNSSQVPSFTVDSKGRILSITNSPIAAGGTVTSISGSGGSTGLTLTGGPITTAGTLTLGGTLAIANGGTGATTATGAINALVPSQSGQSGKFLTTNGTTVSWATVLGSGTVTSVGATGNNGITVSGSPVTTSGTITFGLGTITPTSVTASGTVTGSNLSGTHTGTSSGTNTGDQTITLTGDVTGSGTGTFGATLSTTGVTANTYGSATQVPVFSVDAKGRITGVTNTPISGATSATPEIVVWHFSSGGSGNFTAGDALFSQTAGVTTAITDASNCLATYTFTGKANPPKSIMFYGQNYTTNSFNIVSGAGPYGAAAANIRIAGGGTSALPDLANGIFGVSNVITLQTRMADVGASAGLGQRAWLVIVFGF